MVPSQLVQEELQTRKDYKQGRTTNNPPTFVLIDKKSPGLQILKLTLW